MKTFLFPALAMTLLASSALAAGTEPGAGGVSIVGALVALGAAASLAFIGFVWYPIKRLRRKIRAHAAEPPPQPVGENASSFRK